VNRQCADETRHRLQFKVFEAVARLLNLSRAAEELHLAHTVAQELSNCRLTALAVRGFLRRFNCYVVHRRQKRLAPVAQAVKDFLRGEGDTLIARMMQP
jgi:DNA-binding transcriptional LysR family regulator